MDYSKLPAREIERAARVIHPGAWAVERERPLATLLGSCVTVCLYDPQARIGGINHFMLPAMKSGKNRDVDSLLSGDFAMEALLNALLKQGARKNRLQAKAFGGGAVIASSLQIGGRNVEFAREWLAREGIALLASDFLGPWSRKVLFLPNTGDAWCRRIEASVAATAQIVREERAYAESLQKKPRPDDKKIELF
ncbi:MAG: chemotaxis protein CheD [Rhodocyclaceae bacterium]|jgi:chemotaxis protein CheD|nr:chemotaxis protein CheD [Rhodocyclaceae bacterium]MCL4757490.1 chemotaxis protein CheD [Rhodocyclaceae bacterium]